MAGLYTLLEGRTLAGRYRVERMIARGGMGAVFRAFDLRLRRAVALKVIAFEPDDGVQFARLRGRFEREAHAAARLRHRHVVTVFDSGVDEATGLDFIVMELLEGESLHERIHREGRIAPAVALRLLGEAGRGLGAGHAAGMVHRDVKPGNLFLVGPAGDPRVEACVLDFGIAQVADELPTGTLTHLTLFGRAPLSPGYASPEQWRGITPLTPACDVYGLGVTAFHALTGRLPFTDEERGRIAAGEALRAPPLHEHAAEVPEGVERVVARALEPSPRDRYADGAAFADALEEALAAAALPRAAAPLAPEPSGRPAPPPPSPSGPGIRDPAPPVPAAGGIPGPLRPGGLCSRRWAWSGRSRWRWSSGRPGPSPPTSRASRSPPWSSRCPPSRIRPPRRRSSRSPARSPRRRPRTGPPRLPASRARGRGRTPAHRGSPG